MICVPFQVRFIIKFLGTFRTFEFNAPGVQTIDVELQIPIIAEVFGTIRKGTSEGFQVDMYRIDVAFQIVLSMES